MKKPLKQSFLTLLCFLSCGFAHAMQSIEGKVTDPKGEVLIGVAIQIEGTSTGTITNVSGDYSLSANDGDVLVYSFVGYKTAKRIVSNSQLVINVSMEDDAAQLQEVVVTALGFKANKDELGYANTTVSSSAITGAAETNMLNSLSGKSSGVRISRNSGDPGAGAFIQIRGLSTITRDSQPLIVVDGIPISNDTRGNGAGRTAVQSRLNDINPNDIESVSVLKGASAAALWGTRALGGVIFITTKSGEFNKKLSVSFKSSYSIDQINRKYPTQTKFGQGDNGAYNQRARDSWGDRISDRSGAADDFDTSGQFYVGQDGNTYYPILNKNSRTLYNESNFDQIFQNGHFFENNLSISAGNENSTIFASLSDMNQEGIIKSNSDYRRTTARINTEHILTEKVSMNASFSYAKTSSNRIRRGASSSGLYLGLLRNPADFDISGYRGDYYANSTSAPITNRHRSYREPLGADGTATYNNPLWTINEQENLANVDRFIASIKLTANPVDWLELTARVGLDQYSELSQQFYTPGSAAGEFTAGRFNKELAKSSIFNMDYIAKGNFNINKDIDATVLVGFNYNHRQLTVDGTDIQNFIQFTDVASTVRDIDNTLPENSTSQSTFGQERTAGVYTSANISGYDMLYLNASIRAESASTFGDAADNTFLFPSASLAWQFTQLDALQNNILSFGKLRLSYGEVGVQPGRYNSSNIFVSPSYGDEYGGDLSLGLYGNGGFVPSTSRGSTDLKPERKRETEFGTDLRLLNDRLSISATYFSNETEDVLLDFPIANSRGYDEIYANAASIQNTGLELDLGYAILNKGDLNWNANLNYTAVKNEVTNLAGVQSINIGGLSAVNSRAIEGQAMGVLWGSRTLRDDSGNIVFDSNGFPEQDQLEGVIGDPNPDWQGSIMNTLSYKNFSLSILLETFQGADIFAGTKSVMTDLGTWADSDLESSADQNLLDYNGNVILAGTSFRGKVHNFGDGPVALTESWYNGDGGFFSGGNDELYIEDGSWTRIRELTVSYRFKPELIKKAGLTSLELSATGRNLFLWTEFEGNDPDTNFSGVSAARGIDYFNNPGTKSYVFTLSLTF
jgi:TonB-linked SusC/RagA family outer membrane protein